MTRRFCLSAACAAAVCGFTAVADEVVVPAVVTERAALWLDASDTSTLMLGEGNAVTGWVSKAAVAVGKTAEVATVPSDHLAPVYDTTTYGIPTVDFGEVTSLKDMVFPRKTGITAAFFVMKIAKSQDAFWLGDSTYNFHRGANGIYGDSGYAKFSIVQKNGTAVDWRNEVVPDDAHYVFGIMTSSGIAACSLTQDRTLTQIPKRNGGKQLSELILFTSAISDSDFGVVTSYLMRKWGFAVPKITVNGSPRNIGYPTPPYGDCTNLEDGKDYVFAAPATFVTDSQLLKIDCLGWTFVDGDAKVTEGDENSVTVNFSGAARYGSLTWRWSDYQQLAPPAQPTLPYPYRLVEYLEQDTGAYVDTGISLTTNTTEVVLTVGSSETAAFANDTKWAGTMSQTAGCAQFSLGYYQSKWRILGGVGGWESPTCFPTTRGPLAVSIRGNEWTFMNRPTGEFVNHLYQSQIAGTKNAVKPLYLFAVNDNNVPTHAPGAGARIYGLEVYEKGVCVHNLRPCFRKADRKPGFFDMVTGDFIEATEITKGSGGTLVCGPELRVVGTIIIVK